MISYRAPVERRSLGKVLAALDEGDVALVSDAGTPTLSDPGQALVDAAWTAGHRVVPIPGPSAVTAALAAAGFGGPGFVFLGYLPRKLSLDDVSRCKIDSARRRSKPRFSGP